MNVSETSSAGSGGAADVQADVTFEASVPLAPRPAAMLPLILVVMIVLTMILIMIMISIAKPLTSACFGRFCENTFRLCKACAAIQKHKNCSPSRNWCSETESSYLTCLLVLSLLWSGVCGLQLTAKPHITSDFASKDLL